MLYSLLELYLSVFLVIILTHPRLCTVAVVAPYPAMCIRCGLEACGVCLWCGVVCGVCGCVCAHGLCAMCTKWQCSLCCVYVAVLLCMVPLCCALLP